MNSLSCQPPASKLSEPQGKRARTFRSEAEPTVSLTLRSRAEVGRGADTAPKPGEQKETKPNTEPSGRREGDSTEEEDSCVKEPCL